MRKGKSFIDQRKERISAIRQAVIKLEMVDKKSLIARMSIEIGVTEDKIEEYVDILVQANFIKAKGEMLEAVPQ